MLDKIGAGFTEYNASTTKFGRIRIIVVGKVPLLTHNPESMNVVAEAKKGGRIPPPEVEAEAGAYRLPDGTCAGRGEGYRLGLLGAGGAWKIKRLSARSILAHVIVVEELLPILRLDGTPVSDYVIDARRAIVQGQGIIRHRPCFNEWMMIPTFEYDPVLINNKPELIVDILADAGNRFGVGDYRPRFGRYNVKGYQIL